MSHISVIMPSYLMPYEGCASNRREKFRRAVDSFLNQSFRHIALIIVSDGCDITNEIYSKEYSHYPNIKLIKLSKQTLFSGAVRQAGIDRAHGNIICYLDSDDYFEPDHLQAINDKFDTNKYDWIFYNDFIKHNINQSPLPRGVAPVFGSIGTSAIAHINKKEFNWTGCNGYNHDWAFISRLMHYSNRYTKIEGPRYLVCHIPKMLDN